MRHARTVNNHPSMPVISSGIPGPDLAADGLPRAEEVAKEIHHRFDVGAVHASPLRRAVRTGEIIGFPLGLTPVVVPALTECNVGSLENKSEPADFDTLNGQLARWRQPDGWRVRLGGDGDSGDEVRDRILRYLVSLDCSVDTTIVAVSHALALSSLSDRLPENCGWAMIARHDAGFHVADSDSW